MTVLGNYISIKHGFAFKGEHIVSADNGVVLVTPGNFAVGGGFQEKKCKYYDGEYNDEYVLHADDLIVTMTDLSKQGDTLGYGALVPYKKNRVYLHNQRIGLVKILSLDIDKGYLYWFLRTPLYHSTVVSTSTGSTVKHTSPARICEVPIMLPSIQEQKRISSVLFALDRKIELNNKINENLERQAQAIFRSWFLDYLPFNSIKPTHWKFCTLGETTKMSAGGDKPKGISNIKSTEYPYPIYSNGLDNEGLYGYTNEAKIFAESVTVSARGTIGFVCLRHIPYVPIVRLVTLIPNEDLISAKYLYLYLKQLHISGTGTTQQQLTVPDFRKTEILIPDKITMDKFTNLMSPMFNQIWANEEENIKLASLRDSLLPKLMSGEIEL